MRRSSSISLLGRAGAAAALLLGSAAAATAQARDVVILRHGEVRSGSLRACVSTVCQLDGRTAARAEIASQPESPPIDLTWRHSCPVPLEPTS